MTPPPNPRHRFAIRGAVQGVGYRPFVYSLAQRLGLTGWVLNTSVGVDIEAQGPADALDAFGRALTAEAPPLARPTVARAEPIDIVDGEAAFVIRQSDGGQARRCVIPPDAAVCAACLAELANPADRRHRYPFINCTHCGPRYTLVTDIPYDRPATTMRDFAMCADCQREYTNPADRRFHAQPIACPACGPRVWLSQPNSATHSEENRIEGDAAVREAVRLMENGCIVAVKGLGGFHLACRADRGDAVEALRQRKYRKAKAFALMMRNMEAARRVAEIDAVEADMLAGAEAPIVLCRKRPGASIAEAVAPASRRFGVMLPYTPLHVLLMEGRYPALVMTSGNVTDRPIEHENAEALARLGGIADAFLMHDRRIHTPCDDSVAVAVRGAPMLLRRARGYSPRPLPLPRRSAGDILAVGAEMKNTVTFVTGAEAVVSQHIGDLSDAATDEHFRHTIDKLAALLGARPAALACDLHPAMRSTRYAESYRGARLVRVQHHHAHLAAVMGEHGLDGTVAGLAIDGVGYGPDGTVWGCEAMTCSRVHYRRVAHLAPLPMPGGDAASREPWRMAAAALMATFGVEAGRVKAGALMPQVAPERLDALAGMIRSATNTPPTSSLGRLFDAVSALCGVCLVNTYEAQAAIELEHAVDGPLAQGYPVEIIASLSGQPAQLDPRPAIGRIAADLEAGASPGVVAARFHAWTINGLAALAQQAADAAANRTVALAGGVLQNEIVLNSLVSTLEAAGYAVYFNRELPPGDGAISFGQTVVADAVLGLETPSSGSA